LRGISTSWSLSPLQSFDHNKHKSKKGNTTHTRFNPQHTHAHKPRLELKAQHGEFTTQTELKSLTQQIKCVEAESGCLSMLRKYLVYCSTRLGVPFIAPRQLGAVGHQFSRQFLPSVEWCTGQSGAPPDNHCRSPVLDFLPYRAQPTIGPWDRLVHRTLSGAHRTVRCVQPTVGMDHVSRVDRVDDRWPLAQLTHQTVRWTTGQSVIYSHVAFLFSLERLVDTEPAWGTGHCSVHHRIVRCASASWCWLNFANFSSIQIFFSWHCF
jgi:hypothetical protein